VCVVSDFYFCILCCATCAASALVCVGREVGNCEHRSAHEVVKWCGKVADVSMGT